MLNELRQEIDKLDAELLEKLSQRARLAQKVGEVKKQEGTSTNFYRPERERAVLERLKSLNQGPLSNDEVARLFREIMSACLALEHKLKIAYLGPEGTFTQAAALKHFGGSALCMAKKGINEVFRAVEGGECLYGVVPVENSTEGMISYTLDLLALSQLKICGEVILKIEQNLLSKEQNLEEIELIYSHDQSFAQCRQWLMEYLPQAKLISCPSNALAVQNALKTPKSAAIAGKIAAKTYDLPIFKANIQDKSNNTTRFLILGKDDIKPTGADKTSIVLSTTNTPGSLYQLLEPIGRHGVNMSKIESRPSQQALWEYIFFVDLEGHQDHIAPLLKEMKERAGLFRILGSYPKSL